MAGDGRGNTGDPLRRGWQQIFILMTRSSGVIVVTIIVVVKSFKFGNWLTFVSRHLSSSLGHWIKSIKSCLLLIENNPK